MNWARQQDLSFLIFQYKLVYNDDQGKFSWLWSVLILEFSFSHIERHCSISSWRCRSACFQPVVETLRLVLSKWDFKLANSSRWITGSRGSLWFSCSESLGKVFKWFVYCLVDPQDVWEIITRCLIENIVFRDWFIPRRCVLDSVCDMRRFSNLCWEFRSVNKNCISPLGTFQTACPNVYILVRDLILRRVSSLFPSNEQFVLSRAICRTKSTFT